MAPALSGEYISPLLRLKVPKEYFTLFDWFDTQEPDKKVLYLPAFDYVGWQYHDWGYRGSGFLWYGIKQPIIDRTFDTWGSENEALYLELRNAIYTGNSQQFNEVLHKYNIGYILLDEHLISPEENQAALFVPEIKELLSSTTGTEEVFSAEQITVYETNYGKADAVQLLNNPATTSNLNTWTYKDELYSKYGDYITGDEPSVIPIAYSLEERTGVEIEDENGLIHLKSNVEFKDGYQLKNQGLKTSTSPEGFIEILFDKETNTYEKLKSFNQSDEFSIEECLQEPKNAKATSSIKTDSSNEKYLELYASKSGNCLLYDLPKLSQAKTYLMKISGKHITGKQLVVFVQNPSTNRNVTIVPLEFSSDHFDDDYIFIPSSAEDERGYNVLIQNISIGREESINYLSGIEAFSIPYDDIKKIVLIKNDSDQVFSSNRRELSQGKESITRYSGTINRIYLGTGTSQLAFFQSYDPGWQAYSFKEEPSWFASNLPFFFGDHLSEHNKINNWANAWSVDKSTDRHIIIYYWPQLLQWSGIVLIAYMFCSILIVIYLDKHKTGRKKTQR
jgi:hypothetical protein